MNLRRFIPNTRTDPARPNIDLEADDVYHILSARRRRLVLLRLADLEAGEVMLEELARVLASKETGAAALKVPPDAYEAAYVALYQSHVPVLDEHDVVEWDSDRGVLRSKPLATELAKVIRDIEERTR